MPRMQGQAGAAGSSSAAAASPQDSPWLCAQTLVGISLPNLSGFSFQLLELRNVSFPACSGRRHQGDLHGSMGKTLDSLIFSGLFESMNPVAVPSLPASLEEALGGERHHGDPQPQCSHCLPAGHCSQLHNEHPGMASHCHSWRADGLILASHLSLLNFCLFNLH